MTDTHYMTCAETAKLVRKALREAFPGVKFSVRSHTYSMGASIYVRWTDGPTGKEVKTVVGAFESATFDGMTDYQGGKAHELNGESVHFGSHWVSETREISDGFLTKVREAYAALTPHERFELLRETNAFHCNALQWRQNGVSMEDRELAELGDEADQVWRTIAYGLSLCPSRGSPTADSAVVVRTY